MEKLILIKLGGSVITDKKRPRVAKEAVIRRLGREILKALPKYNGKIIIGHGSGSFGHTYAARYKTQEGIIDKDSLEGLVKTADVATQINRIVIKNLIKVGLKTVSFAPASFIYAKDKKVSKSFVAPIIKCLDIGIIPVVYGDVVMDEKRGFCIFSGEGVLNTLIKEFENVYQDIKIVYGVSTNGVHDEAGKTIEKITMANFGEFKRQISGSKATDVTGGMLHKVEESLKVAKYGIKTVIINANLHGELSNALLGKSHRGTEILG